MKRTVFSCDKCGTDFEHPTLSFVVPASIGPSLAKLLKREAPVPALDLCGDCSGELARLLTEPHLTFLSLENARDEANAAAQRCLARVRELEGELASYEPATPPTEPPVGMPDPLLDAPATDVPPPADPLLARYSQASPLPPRFAPADPLPPSFVLPGQAFDFSTEPPPVEPEPLPASSPLAFTHGGAQ